MATNDRPTLDLHALAQGLVDELRARARAAPGKTPDEEEREEGQAPVREQLRRVADDLGGERERAVATANDRYRERGAAMQAVLDQRRQRLEAYAERQRQAVPAADDRFVVAGRVTDQATGAGLPHVRVRATDMDRREDDTLGETRTDALGYYRMEYRAEDFDERDNNPETFIEVLDEDGDVLTTSAKSFVQKAGQSAFIAAAVDGGKVPASRRMAEKVNRTVTARRADLERRRRVIEHGPRVPGLDVRVDVGGPGGGIPGGGIVQPDRPPREKERPRPGKSRPGGEAGRPASDAERAPVSAIKGVGPAFGRRLEDAGVRSAREVAKLSAGELAGILDVGEARAAKLVEAARQAVKR